MSDELQFELPDEAATAALAAALARLLRGGEIIGLRGQLGAGKTAFVRAAAATLGSKSLINSPTFVLEHIYETTQGCLRQIHHWDLYRVGGNIDLDQFLELQQDPTRVTFVEWPERSAEIESLLFCTVTLDFPPESDLGGAGQISTRRRALITGLNPDAAAKLRTAL